MFNCATSSPGVRLSENSAVVQVGIGGLGCADGVVTVHSGRLSIHPERRCIEEPSSRTIRVFVERKGSISNLARISEPRMKLLFLQTLEPVQIDQTQSPVCAKFPS